jgi:outer membrane protein OmpA-like peptidoglycan-associated protein
MTLLSLLFGLALAGAPDTTGLVEVYHSKPLFFPSSTTGLIPSHVQQLTGILDAIAADASISRIVVEGHTHPTGSESFQEKDARKRAEIVADYLVDHGIPEATVEVVSYGATRTRSWKTTAQAKLVNRRVEVVGFAPAPPAAEPAPTAAEPAPTAAEPAPTAAEPAP